MFVEVFHSTVNDIHLILVVKTSFDNYACDRGSVRNPVLRNREFPLTAIIDITGRERRRTLHTKKLQSKAGATMLNKTGLS
jgi:hypothetical protein